MKQSNFELRYTETLQHKQYNETDIEAFITPCMNKLQSLLDQPIDRPDLIEIHEVRSNLDHKKVMWKLFHTIIFGREVTVQQLLGLFWNSLNMAIGQRKARVMEPFFIALTASEHITVVKRGVEFIFLSNIEIDSSGYGYILPSLDIPIVTSNNDIGYALTKEHIITGHPLKQHDLPVCLDHINRLNATCYSIEPRLLELYQPKFDPTPKLKKQTAQLETLLEIQQRKESFLHYVTSLPEKVNIMLNEGNKFHICHKYDSRLRTYPKAYHFDYVGHKYSRALVQPHISELTEDANEYF